MIVQNIPNSTNFGSITKYRVKPKDVEHFQKNIEKHFNSGANFVFSESLFHEPTIAKVLEQPNFKAVKEELQNRGIEFNDSFRLNTKDEHCNFYLVNEDKDIRKLNREYGLGAMLKNTLTMAKSTMAANRQIRPTNEFEIDVASSLAVLNFAEKLCQNYEKFAKKHGMREFNYSVRKNGEMALREIDRPIDGVRFRIKTKDADEFVDTVTTNMSAALKRQNKKENFIVENPSYIEYEEKFTELQFGNWANQNLNYRGYQTAIPGGENPQGEFDFYVFTSDEANKKLEKKFEGFRSFPEYIADTIKAKSIAGGFSSSVGGAHNDIHFTDAYNFLYEHELNRFQNERFQKVLKTLNIRNVEYKPRKK